MDMAIPFGIQIKKNLCLITTIFFKTAKQFCYYCHFQFTRYNWFSKLIQFKYLPLHFNKGQNVICETFLCSNVTNKQKTASKCMGLYVSSRTCILCEVILDKFQKFFHLVKLLFNVHDFDCSFDQKKSSTCVTNLQKGMKNHEHTQKRKKNKNKQGKKCQTSKISCINMITKKKKKNCQKPFFFIFLHKSWLVSILF